MFNDEQLSSFPLLLTGPSSMFSVSLFLVYLFICFMKPAHNGFSTQYSTPRFTVFNLQYSIIDPKIVLAQFLFSINIYYESHQ
jgi:hypothetical protein